MITPIGQPSLVTQLNVHSFCLAIRSRSTSGSMP